MKPLVSPSRTQIDTSGRLHRSNTSLQLNMNQNSFSSIGSIKPECSVAQTTKVHHSKYMARIRRESFSKPDSQHNKPVTETSAQRQVGHGSNDNSPKKSREGKQENQSAVPSYMQPIQRKFKALSNRQSVDEQMAPLSKQSGSSGMSRPLLIDLPTRSMPRSRFQM